jgi:hypothetical protein
MSDGPYSYCDAQRSFPPVSTHCQLTSTFTPRYAACAQPSNLRRLISSPDAQTMTDHKRLHFLSALVLAASHPGTARAHQIPAGPCPWTHRISTDLQLTSRPAEHTLLPNHWLGLPLVLPRGENNRGVTLTTSKTSVEIKNEWNLTSTSCLYTLATHSQSFTVYLKVLIRFFVKWPAGRL